VLKRIIVLAGPGLALAALVAPVVVLGERLPDPLATHWDLGGTPDGRTAAAAFTAGLVVAVAAGWAVLGAQAARRPDRRHRLTAAPVAWGLAGVALAIQAVTVAVNLDAPRWEQAGAVGLWIVPVVLAAGAGPAWLAHRLERGRPVAAGAGGRPPQRASVGLAPGERAVWTAHTSSPYGGAAAAAAAVLLPAAGFVAGGAQGWILVGAGLVLAVAIGP
jgi:hypothetical protein